MSQRRELIEAFGPDAGHVLHSWATQREADLRVVKRLTNGRTGAPVVVVTQEPAEAGAHKLVVKLCSPDDANELCEPGRHMKALAYSRSFADRHLVEYVHDPIPLGNGDWIVFQRYVGGSRNMPTLAALLDSVVDPSSHPVSMPDAGELAKVCETLVILLSDWSPVEGVGRRGRTVTTAEFVASHLGRRLESGGSLHVWAQRAVPHLLDPSVRSMRVGTVVLPNPFAIVLDRPHRADDSVWTLWGPAHGDLHPENVFVPLRDGAGGTRRSAATDFRLVDLERFDERAPLSLDPSYLTISIAGRHLAGMSADQQAALARFIVDPADGRNGDRLPAWLQKLTMAIARAAALSVDEAYLPDWQRQSTLSLLACALLFAGRRTTPEPHREWFLQLAGRAAEIFLSSTGTEGATSAPAAMLLPTPIASESLPRAPETVETAEPPVTAPIETLGSTGAEPNRAPAQRSDEGGDLAVRRRRSPLAPHLRIAADTLADAVLQQWEEAFTGRRLESPGPIRVTWARSRRSVVGPVSDAVGRTIDLSCTAPGPALEGTEPTASVAGGIVHLTGGDVGDLFTAVYCRLLRPGRLVILGDQGTGKTATAIKLVLDVLRYRAGRADDEERTDIAVPVILTPHDWDPEHQRLPDWLAQRLAAEYMVPRSGRRGLDEARELVRSKRVALVLDGLDDMPERVRSVALKALDRAAFRVVVLSRSIDMVDAALGSHLAAAVAVELQPVEAGEAAAYLTRCATDPPPPSWQRLVDHVQSHPEGPVARALASPLMLGLARDTYANSDAIDELLDTARFATSDHVEDHLLRRVLPVAYEPEPGQARPPYSHEQARAWLTAFARQMRQENTRDLAWWRLPDMVPVWPRTAVYTLAMGLLAGCLFGGLGALQGEPLRGFVGGSVFGPAAAFFDRLIVTRDRQAERRATLFRIVLGYVLTSTATGLLTGVLLVGVGRGALAGLGGGAAVGLAVGTPAVMWAGRTLGLVNRPAAAADSPLSPAACWRQDRRTSTLFGWLLGLTVCVTLVVVCVLVGEPLVRVAAAAVVEPLVMFAFVVTLSLRAKTTLAALQLRRQGRSPVRLIRFLEDARDRNVLRSAGSIYQFRHARLQDLLVDGFEDRDDDPKP